MINTKTWELFGAISNALGIEKSTGNAGIDMNKKMN
jgi:hypothetical protein